MKKVFAAFLLSIILVVFSANSFAQSTSTTSSKSTSTAVANIKDIKYSKSSSQDQITIYTSKYKGYKVFYIPKPDRIVVDIPNSAVTVKGQRTIKVGGIVVKDIRYSQYTKNSVRLVFDVAGNTRYQVAEKNGSLVFTMKKPVSGSKDAEKPSVPSAPTVPSAPSAPSTPSTPSAPSRGNDDRSTGRDVGGSGSVTADVMYGTSFGVGRVILSGKNYEGYSAMRLTGPDRIVVDIPGSTGITSVQQTINVGSKLIKDIRYAQSTPDMLRIVVDTVGQPQYGIGNGYENLTLSVENPSYKNILYNNNGDRIYFSLEGAKLTEAAAAVNTGDNTGETAAEAAGLKMLYTGSYDESGKKYTISFPSYLADIGSGTMQINDGVLDSVEIRNDAATQNTLITFNAKASFTYEIITNPDTNRTEINILKPYDKKDNLVVIDAGHGGDDSGAAYAGVQEKDFNLKIALKLNNILKSKGINTYMTRDDDTFIPLYDRANAANDLNAALFLSIHNNAFNTSEYGTETLYYPSDRSKWFAQLVQDTLVSTLGTKDRGIIERPNLVVLYATKMPAALAEVAFVTNSDDRSKLLDDGFIQNAASALSEAVVKALGSSQQ